MKKPLRNEKPGGDGPGVGGHPRVPCFLLGSPCLGQVARSKRDRGRGGCFILEWTGVLFSRSEEEGTFLVVQWLRVHAPSAGGPGSILARGLDLTCINEKIPSAATKTRCNQQN